VLVKLVKVWAQTGVIAVRKNSMATPHEP